MKIGLVTPAPPKSRYGNRVTALRWARILRGLGHLVSVKQAYEGEPFDLLIALHARRSFASITRFHREHPDKPIIVALTGTDLYGDLARSSRAHESLKLATRIVALQPKSLDVLRPPLRKKTRVIYQSVAAFKANNEKERRSTPDARLASTNRARLLSSLAPRTFDVCVIGHLRPVKDPFRAAVASRLLPVSSRVRVTQVGGAMTEQAAVRARAEMKTNARYCWLGEQPAWRVRRILERSRLFVLSSQMEGGANALGEAIVAGTPVLASHIPGSVGILGEGYSGYFQVGDTSGLARLMTRAETDVAFLAQLTRHCKRLVPLFDPAREAAAWVKLLGELVNE
ncbi:MAG TPA: glycosyltransferase [Blastocatellia bacterium]|nr:glycosyltransferase [Blastocatellia bacterium]